MPKTKTTNKNFFENRNTSDILNRLVILGLLRLLNKQLVYQQIWDDTEEGIENITVPFFYDFVGGATTSERFIQDNYNNFTDDECTSAGIKKMDGDFKPIPFGVITLTSTMIDSGNISNRFVMGRYTKKENGELKPYVSFLYSIPLSMAFTAYIKCDTMTTTWKIEQAIREFFYKNRTIHVNYRGTTVPVRVGFAETYTEDKQITYQYAQTNEGFDIKLSFDLVCETYQPVFDPMNERPADNTMKNLAFNIANSHNKISYGNNKSTLHPITDLSDMVVTTGEDVILEWKNYDYENDTNYVDILYQEQGSDKFNLIESIENNNFYHWIVPDDFVDEAVTFDIIIPPVEKVVMHTQPILKIYPRPDTCIVDESCVAIISKGVFFSDMSEYAIPAFISYEDKDGKIIDKEFYINIMNGGVDLQNPIHIEPFVYNGNVNHKKINIVIQKHGNPSTRVSFLKDENKQSSWLSVC